MRHEQLSLFAYGALGLFLGAFVMLYNLHGFPHYLIPSFFRTHQPAPFSGDALAASEPVRIRVPAIGADASFEMLGLLENGEVGVPKKYENVGWYTGSPTPGEEGASVVLGHVDSVHGPAVFYSLPSLKEGDPIYIEREDGSTVVFRVIDSAYYSQSNFPAEEIYGDREGTPELRLITCTGSFDTETLRYSHNYVVYAAMDDQTHSEESATGE